MIFNAIIFRNASYVLLTNDSCNEKRYIHMKKIQSLEHRIFCHFSLHIYSNSPMHAHVHVNVLEFIDERLRWFCPLSLQSYRLGVVQKEREKITPKSATVIMPLIQKRDIQWKVQPRNPSKRLPSCIVTFLFTVIQASDKQDVTCSDNVAYNSVALRSKCNQNTAGAEHHEYDYP